MQKCLEEGRNDADKTLKGMTDRSDEVRCQEVKNTMWESNFRKSG